MLKIGFSTGALYKSLSNDISRVGILRRMGYPIIELGFMRLGDLTNQNINDLPRNILLDFSYRSFHAPVYGYQNDATTKYIFSKIAGLHAKLPLDLVVFHPDPVVDFGVFEDLPFRVGFENMDNRKNSCQTPAELEAILAGSENFSLVLDLNHAYSNDPSMKLAAEFYKRLGPRIAQIHLSGYNGHHGSLFQTRQANIIRSIQDPTVPIIIESVVGPADLRKETFYIVWQIVMNGLR